MKLDETSLAQQVVSEDFGTSPCLHKDHGELFAGGSSTQATRGVKDPWGEATKGVKDPRNTAQAMASEETAKTNGGVTKQPRPAKNIRFGEVERLQS